MTVNRPKNNQKDKYFCNPLTTCIKKIGIFAFKKMQE